jgi:hypothetical protein
MYLLYQVALVKILNDYRTFSNFSSFLRQRPQPIQSGFLGLNTLMFELQAALPSAVAIWMLFCEQLWTRSSPRALALSTALNSIAGSFRRYQHVLMDQLYQVPIY